MGIYQISEMEAPIKHLLELQKGDLVEILPIKEGLLLKKLAISRSFAQDIADCLFRATGASAIVSDKEKIIAAAGSNANSYMNQNIGDDIKSVLITEKGILKNNPDSIIPNQDINIKSCAIVPIASLDENMGAVVLVAEFNLDIADIKMARMAASFISKRRRER